MLFLQVSAFVLSVLIWQSQYTAVFLDGTLIVIFLVAAISFLRDACKMVKRRS